VLQLGLLGALCVGIALLSDGAWAIASGTARTWLASSPRRLEIVGGAGGLTLIGLGVRLAVGGQRT
jgi:threonine/homoserine/homoserine lactone efflux protein